MQGKGPAAAAVRDMMARMRREAPPPPAPPPGSGAPRIGRLLLLDREVDMLTPMMTQLTFEGLLDEVTGIKAGMVPWQPASPGSSASPAPHTAAASISGGGSVTPLNSSDPLFRELRDLPFHAAAARWASTPGRCPADAGKAGGHCFVSWERCCA